MAGEKPDRLANFRLRIFVFGGPKEESMLARSNLAEADSDHSCRTLLLFMFPGVSSEACTFEVCE